MRFGGDIYNRRRIWKFSFLTISALLIAVFLFISNRLMKDLAAQERDRMEVWADATKNLAAMTSTNGGESVDFLLSIIERNHSIPVLLTDEQHNILMHRNFTLPVRDEGDFQTSPENMRYLEKKLEKLKNSPNHIVIKIDDHTTQHLFYEDSIVLTHLSYFPYIQLVVLVVFLLIVYFALASVRRAEQNKVWVGLSKETAHQLGTPISSLMAWMQMLDAYGVDKEVVGDMNKDVVRLSVIADRFSKIGSNPEKERVWINEAVQNSLEYMRSRISKRVKLTVHTNEDDNCAVNLCTSLFEWVMENLTKNAVDAMQGEGCLDIYVRNENGRAIIDVKDTGKGIARKNFKTVFNPGYTTKKRGWGLGLTLVKRIIEEYHGGKIYVKESTLNAGTTFRIEL
ncbi:MAG: HAMP domain-containing histidine kinase [Muribaculaceae bacterium]|nr:HAMP domain-containing histidine kinase [Muribaculaceae bacterium]